MRLAHESGGDHHREHGRAATLGLDQPAIDEFRGTHVELPYEAARVGGVDEGSLPRAIASFGPVRRWHSPRTEQSMHFYALFAIFLYNYLTKGALMYFYTSYSFGGITWRHI